MKESLKYQYLHPLLRKANAQIQNFLLSSGGIQVLTCIDWGGGGGPRPIFSSFIGEFYKFEFSRVPSTISPRMIPLVIGT